MINNIELYYGASGLKEAGYSATNLIVGVFLIFAAFQLVKIRGPILSLFTDWLDEVIRILTMAENSAFGGTMQGYDQLNPNKLGGVGMDGKNGVNSDNFSKGMGQTAAQASAGGGYGMPASGSPGDGGVTGGSMKRSNRLSNPRGALGRLRNAKAIYNDQKRARLARRGELDNPASATNFDKGIAAMKTMRNAVVPELVSVVDGAMGTHMGSDLRGIYDANLDDDLSKFDQNARMQEELKGFNTEKLEDNDDIDIHGALDGTQSSGDEIARRNEGNDNYDFDGNQIDKQNIYDVVVDSEGNPLAEFVDQHGEYVPPETVVGDAETGYRDLDGNEVYMDTPDKVYEDEDGNIYTPRQITRNENGDLIVDKKIESDIIPVAGTEGAYRGTDGNLYSENEVFKEAGDYFAIDEDGDKVPVGRLSNSGEYKDSEGNVFNSNDPNTEILSRENGSLYARTKVGSQKVQESSYVDGNGNSYDEQSVSRAYIDGEGNLTRDKYSSYRSLDGTAIASENIKRDAQGNPLKDDKGYILKNPLTNELTGKQITRAVGGNTNRLVDPRDRDGIPLYEEYTDSRGNMYGGNNVLTKHAVKSGNSIIPVSKNDKGIYVDDNGKEYSKDRVEAMNFARDGEKIVRVNNTGNYVDGNGDRKRVASSIIGATNKNGDFVEISKRETKKVAATKKTLTSSGVTNVASGISGNREIMKKRLQQANDRTEQMYRNFHNNPRSKENVQALEDAKYHRRKIIKNMDIRDLPKGINISKSDIDARKEIQSTVLDVRNSLYELQKAKERLNSGLGSSTKDTVTSLENKLDNAGVKKSIYNKSANDLKYILLDLDKYING